MIRIIFFILVMIFHQTAMSYDISSSLINKKSDFEKLYLDYKNRIRDQDYRNKVRIQILNKITAKTYTLDLIKNKIQLFNTLNLKLLSCWHSPPDATNENKALIEIYEKRADGYNKKIYYDWMLSSNSSFSSLQHAIYYVKILECI